jgi:hypothetical protein
MHSPLGAGCFVSPIEGSDAVQVSLSLSLPGGPQGKSTFPATGSPFDNLGQFHLELFPKYVRVAVSLEGEDYELTNGTWPDPEQGIGPAGEGAQGQVEVSLTVPAGEGRQFSALGYVYDEGQVIAYQEADTKSVDLVAGQDRDVTLEMIPQKSGAAEISVRCEYGNSGPWQPVQVSLIDAQAFVLFPPVHLDKHPITQALSVQLGGIPLDRLFQTRVYVENVVSGGTKWADVRSPAFSVAEVSEIRAVNLTIPCHAF